MIEESILRTSSSRFKYVVFSLVSLFTVYSVIVLLMGLSGVSRYSGGKLFSLLFFPLLFLFFVGFVSYWVIVRRSAEYFSSGGGKIYSLEDALRFMKFRARNISGVEPRLSYSYGAGHYGDEPSTRITHAVFSLPRSDSFSCLLLCMQNESPYDLQFESFVSFNDFSRRFISVFDLLVGRLTKKPFDVETVRVSETNPLTGGVRQVVHRKPVKSEVKSFSNEEFVDKKVVVEEEKK